MIKMKSCLLAGACMVITGAAQAAEAPKTPVGPIQNVKFGGSLRGQYTGDDNLDLGTQNEDYQKSQSIELKVRGQADLTNTTTIFGEARGVKNYGAGSTLDLDTGETSGSDDFLELRQLWVEERELFGNLPWGVRVGRQRFSEPYAFWWNRDFDAARLMYDTTIFNAFLAVGENLMSYRTTGDDFLEQNEDVMRVMAETSWQYTYNHFFETRFMWQNDHSGMEAPGTVVSSTDRDTEDGDLFWGGVRARGQVKPFFKAADDIQYRVDLVGVAGTSDVQTTVAGPGSDRTVTGHEESDVLGWAFDAGVNIPLPVYGNPLLMLGYAYGSGDDDPADGDDHAFRQTGLDSNSTRFGLASGTVYHYGFALRPDLSNLHILTAGIGVPLLKASDISGIYHYYHLAEDATELSSSGISADLNGEDKSLGQAVDVILNVNVARELSMPAGIIDGVNFKTMVGVFKAGPAFGPEGDGEVATRGVAELQFKF